MRRPFVLAVLSAIAFASSARAARPSFAYEVVVEEPKTLQDVLRDRLGYGWTCAAVARPEGARLATSVAVVLAQEKGADVPLKRDVRVITSTPGGLDEFARRLDASAAQGFGVCGLTMTAPIWGRPGGDHAVVAVLTRTSDTPTGVTYRAVDYTGRKDEWAAVQQSAADGFAVTRVVSRPQPDVSSTSDMTFLAEKTAASRPLKYDKVLGGNGPGLQKDIDKSTARGFCVQATWATPERMTVLLAQPIDAACSDRHAYEVEESSAFMGFSVSSTDGVLLGVHRLKDTILGLYDGKDGSFEYTIEEGRLLDADSHPLRLPREHRQLVDKLNADGDRGYRPVDVVWRDAGAEGSRAVDVVLGRKRD
jgi:hypothetical protein